MFKKLLCNHEFKQEKTETCNEIVCLLICSKCGKVLKYKTKIKNHKYKQISSIDIGYSTGGSSIKKIYECEKCGNVKEYHIKAN